MAADLSWSPLLLTSKATAPAISGNKFSLRFNKNEKSNQFFKDLEAAEIELSSPILQIDFKKHAKRNRAPLLVPYRKKLRQ
ncbi:MAG: hypothetical protein K2X27_00260 [Candidatus Obscuribacterales bacterium]|nr:hypothetical protein [Candidatus Obscuribacterales bacterium]